MAAQRPTVYVVATGGSISGLGPHRLDYILYPELGQRLSIEEMLARIPEANDLAEIQAENLIRIGSASIGPTEWLQLAQRINALLSSARPPQGVVVTHGTATLEETADADLVLHVIDASASDRDRRMNAVRSVLDEVGAIDVPMLEVYNKCDALTGDERRRLQDQDPSALCISALTRQGIDELVETIASRLALDVVRVTLTFNPESAADRERIARVYRHARVVLHETRDNEVSMVADIPRRLLNRLG